MCICIPQVFLGPNGEVEEYAISSIHHNTAISSDLVLDEEEQHLFIMTHNMVNTYVVAMFCFSDRPCVFCKTKPKEKTFGFEFKYPLFSFGSLLWSYPHHPFLFVLFKVSCQSSVFHGSLLWMVCVAKLQRVVLITAAKETSSWMQAAPWLSLLPAGPRSLLWLVCPRGKVRCTTANVTKTLHWPNTVRELPVDRDQCCIGHAGLDYWVSFIDSHFQKKNKRTINWVSPKKKMSTHQ